MGGCTGRSGLAGALKVQMPTQGHKTHLERACPFETYAGRDFCDDIAVVMME